MSVGVLVAGSVDSVALVSKVVVSAIGTVDDAGVVVDESAQNSASSSPPFGQPGSICNIIVLNFKAKCACGRGTGGRVIARACVRLRACV